MVAATLFASCSNGGGGGQSFGVASINLPANSTWQINRSIRIQFTDDVDFSTVNLNTINIRALNGGPSAGEFYLTAPDTVVFQPRCPTLDDLSDAGLAPGGALYEMTVLGADNQAPLTVRSTSGVGLAVGDTRQFVTPTSSLPLDLFFDSKVGPPVPLVRSAVPSDMSLDASYIELGDDPNNRVYFRIDATGQGFLDPLQELPLNRLSQVDEHVALMLFFNQAVDPSSLNVNAKRLSWQFNRAKPGDPDDWAPLTTEVELVANCTQTGALVRISPRGILPPDTALRVVVAPEFSDIVGQTNLLTQATFAQATTEPAPVSPLPLPDQFMDRYASTADLDTTAGFAEPPAVIKDGKLSASFSFTGTGGINGDFDWKVPAGQTFIFSTDSQNITGGPNFIAQHNVTVIGGVLDLRNLRIETGGTLKVQGTKPLTILASGFVEILGTLDISGSNNLGVKTLNTTNVPEVGAAGQAGGGQGGTGSPLVTSSSPKGGNGFGAFNSPDGGGVGGETGWSNSTASNLNARRGAGGGGGTFGSNQPQTAGSVATFGDWDQSFLGLDGEPGFSNLSAGSNGSSSGSVGPLGGSVGPSPFGDQSTANNFYGLALVANTLIQGELKKPWAGAGGGAGGDASFVGSGGTFPQIPFNPLADEKGGGGGGGGGSLQIMALGNIVFGLDGRIVCRGGSGGGGENTSFVNRVGGAGGGGSGGHVILQTAGVIDLSLAGGVGTIPGTLKGGILATGGQGGGGLSDLGGSILGPNGKIDTLPDKDACPKTLAGTSYPVSGTNACRGLVDGAGGDGGPGLIQLQTPDGLPSILLPAGKTLANLCKPTPIYSSAMGGRLVPSFGRRSRAQSDWIALGEGGFEKAVGMYGNVTFSFGGTDPSSGLVDDDGSGMVQQLPPVQGPDTLVTAPGVPSITGPRQLLLGVNDLIANPDFAYLVDDPNQLENFILRLSAGATVELFDVASATYDSVNAVLTIDVSESGPPLNTSFGPGSQAALLPAYFRVYSNSTPDALPASSTISIFMQATTADPLTGLPDEGNATPFDPDPEVLNLAGNNADFRFMRYQVLFDLAASGGSLTPTNPIPSIDFLRLPFRYGN